MLHKMLEPPLIVTTTTRKIKQLQHNPSPCLKYLHHHKRSCLLHYQVFGIRISIFFLSENNTVTFFYSYIFSLKVRESSQKVFQWCTKNLVLCVFSDTHNIDFGKFWVSEESLRCPNHFWISKSIYAKQGFITDKRKQKQLHYSILIEDNNLNIISVTSKKASFPFCR